MPSTNCMVRVNDWTWMVFTKQYRTPASFHSSDLNAPETRFFGLWLGGGSVAEGIHFGEQGRCSSGAPRLVQPPIRCRRRLAVLQPQAAADAISATGRPANGRNQLPILEIPRPA